MGVKVLRMPNLATRGEDEKVVNKLFLTMAVSLGTRCQVRVRCTDIRPDTVHSRRGLSLCGKKVSVLYIFLLD